MEVNCTPSVSIYNALVFWGKLWLSFDQQKIWVNQKYILLKPFKTSDDRKIVEYNFWWLLFLG